MAEKGSRSEGIGRRGGTSTLRYDEILLKQVKSNFMIR